jgi:formate--tetrahydrofolate ligase
VNDRALRRVTVAVSPKDKAARDGADRETGFVITAASEIMAILGLASSRADLRRRLDSIVVGISRAGRPVTAADLGATGSMMALLNEALLPNLVQTTEGTPAFVHTGPFANIAHGTSSVLSQQMALRLADYVVNEAGFAADLGAEKYFDIVMRSSGIEPAVAVLVTTVQSLRGQGEGSLESGLPNLEHHVGTLRRYGVPVVVAINRFPSDTQGELEVIATECRRLSVPCSFVEAFAKGGLGAVGLAEKVACLVEENHLPGVRSIYSLEETPEEKINKIATLVYGASGVELSELAQEKLARFAEWGFGRLPVCIAKTQYSLTDDPHRLGAPTGWTLKVRDVQLSAGAGFLVAVAGNMMLMPGLPKAPRALAIDVDADGNITGV